MDQASFERIEAFVLKRMSDQERKAFLREMEENEALRSEVALQTELINAIETESMKAALTSMHEEHFGKGAPSAGNRGVFRLPRGWAMAASVAVLITAGWFLLRSPEAPTAQLYTQYYITDPGLATTLSVQSDPTFVEGMVDYKLGKIEAAIERWQPLLQQNPTSDTLRYYLGMAYLESDQTMLAIEQLGQVRSVDTDLSERAQWYLALAHLKNENTTEAVKLLQQLANSNSGKLSDRASQLLTEL